MNKREATLEGLLLFLIVVFAYLLGLGMGAGLCL